MRKEDTLVILETSERQIHHIIEDHHYKIGSRGSDMSTATNNYTAETLRLVDKYTHKDQIFITGEDAAKKAAEYNASLPYLPGIVVGTNFYHRLFEDANDLWRNNLSPINFSRQYLPDLTDKPVGYIPGRDGRTIEEQAYDIRVRNHISGGVVVMDDNASQGASSLRKAAEALADQGVHTSAYLVGFYAGTESDDSGNHTTLNGMPIIAVQTRFNDPAELNYRKSRGLITLPSIETIDLGYLPGAGQAMAEGYPEARSSLQLLTRILQSHDEYHPNELYKILEYNGIIVNLPGSLTRVIEESNGHITINEVIKMLSNHTQQAILTIPGLHLDMVDKRRIPRVWPGNKETPQSFWDTFTLESWKKFSDGMLMATIHLLEETEGATGYYVTSDALPFLHLPEVQTMFPDNATPSRAIDGLNILRHNLAHPKIHNGIEI